MPLFHLVEALKRRLGIDLDSDRRKTIGIRQAGLGLDFCNGRSVDAEGHHQASGGGGDGKGGVARMLHGGSFLKTTGLKSESFDQQSYAS